ncbi:hypothetical protein [Sulfobacillus sp. hq2]|uniref:hypothetical protein n=1 Tax=Sulfobacillus sp. hq2 TaxID=2039167 RepID=UPI000CD174B9|nr:hypothetical protein [Sulfobacillus sp. hq2]POB12171.1 hypothetical protein CO251_00665 [Sulfobacillus sp. hq2]
MDFDAYLNRVAALDSPADDLRGPLTISASESLHDLFQAFATQFACDASALVWPSYLSASPPTATIASGETSVGDLVHVYNWQWDFFVVNPYERPRQHDRFFAYQKHAAQMTCRLQITHFWAATPPYFTVMAWITHPLWAHSVFLLDLMPVKRITWTPSFADSAHGIDALWRFDDVSWSLREALLTTAEHAHNAIPQTARLRHAERLSLQSPWTGLRLALRGLFVGVIRSLIG